MDRAKANPGRFGYGAGMGATMASKIVGQSEELGLHLSKLYGADFAKLNEIVCREGWFCIVEDLGDQFTERVNKVKNFDGMKMFERSFNKVDRTVMPGQA